MSEEKSITTTASSDDSLKQSVGAEGEAAKSEAADSKQPKGLYWLFGAEAWERFSYYGMRAILVLYLVSQLQYERKDALALYGIYTGLVYLTPLIGGYLSDRFLGARKAVIIGGCTMALGELLLSQPAMLYPALALLILGNGFFKPNISNIVGGLYKDNDPRRDGGFTIFYMGINLGAFFSPLICGSLGQNFGWSWGFVAAGIGMIIGQIIFNLGQSRFNGAGMPPTFKGSVEEAHLHTKDYLDVCYWIVGIIGITAVSCWLWNITKSASFSLTSSPLPVAVGLSVLFTFIISYLFTHQHGEKQTEEAEKGSSKLTLEEIHRLCVIVIITVFVTFFWMGFEQAGGTMTLFAEEQTQRAISFLGNAFTIPASWFQSINPFIICTFAPLFSIMWYKWDNSKYAISVPAKMGLGMIILGLGFIVMFMGSSLAADGTKVSPMWLVSVYFLHTMGELCLSPVGLSMVSKLSPNRLMSIMMGFWFLSSAMANYFAGILESVLHSYNINMWFFLICSSIGSGILVLLLTPMLKKWMHGKA
ncbi:MAG: peptide MFS transporter [Candidatus Bruticola sp.]